MTQYGIYCANREYIQQCAMVQTANLQMIFLLEVTKYIYTQVSVYHRNPNKIGQFMFSYRDDMTHHRYEIMNDVALYGLVQPMTG